MEPVLVIPAFQPTEGLLTVVEEIRSHRPLMPILVINDGSKPEHGVLFERVRQLGATVLEHAINLGKGQAIKTAINEVLINPAYAQAVGIVTADADGQHLSKDVFKVADSLLGEPTTLWIGARAFDEDVPFRSQLGNTVTRYVFKLLVGRMIYDTQSGLRGIPRHLLKKLMTLRSTRYEFELDMLIEAAHQKLAIKETSIQTVYIDHNSSSHFRPLLDSVRIYFVFLRFCALSIVTALLDFVVFSIAFWFGSTIFASFIFARLVAGTFNFVVSKQMIFRSEASIWPEALKFSCLVLALMGISYVLVHAMVGYLGLNVLVSKVIAEFGLFLLSFAAQRLLIFSRPDEPVEAA
ncbi:MAG: dolichyl-phosphate mannose synthase [Legionellales bacterium]|nr:dolichyl-phosphate mannose synthase [Legionellales bacterium]|tara:strand:+ start:65 stop:1117 length:1053 start_codon:yes stop_codon:yes gene_type:complete